MQNMQTKTALFNNAERNRFDSVLHYNIKKSGDSILTGLDANEAQTVIESLSKKISDSLELIYRHLFFSLGFIFILIAWPILDNETIPIFGVPTKNKELAMLPIPIIISYCLERIIYHDIRLHILRRLRSYIAIKSFKIKEDVFGLAYYPHTIISNAICNINHNSPVSLFICNIVNFISIQLYQFVIVFTLVVTAIISIGMLDTLKTSQYVIVIVRYTSLFILLVAAIEIFTFIYTLYFDVLSYGNEFKKHNYRFRKSHLNRLAFFRSYTSLGIYAHSKNRRVSYRL